MARRASRSIAVMLWAIAAGWAPAAPALAPRLEAVKPERTILHPGQLRDRVAVKFRDGSALRLRAGAMVDQGSGELAALAPVMNGPLAGAVWRRFHPDVPEDKLDQFRATAEQNLSKRLANLNTQFELVLPAGTDPAAAIDALNALDIVEIAEPMPMPVAAPLPPSYEASQGYIQAAPIGTGVAPSWTALNANGAGVRIVDVEYSFNAAHQDLPVVTLIGPAWVDPFNDNNHGTAVLGQLGSRRNGWGTSGGAHGATLYFSAANTASGYNVASAISRTFTSLAAGDVILIEQQAVGPNYTGVPAGTQFGYVPVEWFRPTYDVIVTAVGNGFHVVQAAGNGSQNLDDPVYSTGNGGHWPFRADRDSGALIIGAGAAPPSATPRSRLGFSNWGSTVDVQGWGERVWTTGYGNSYSAEGQNLWYTSGFGGTSSASPVVAAAVAVLQEAYRDRAGTNLSPAAMKLALRSTGTPQAGNTAENIGPLPNVPAALGFILGDTTDCDLDTIPDFLQIQSNAALDCNSDGRLDSCDDRANLSATAAVANDRFGHSVAIDGDWAVIGVRDDDDVAVNLGSAVVYRRSGSNWLPHVELRPTDGAAFDGFGSAVAIRGDTIAIASPFAEHGGLDSGSVYIYRRSGNIWSFEQRLNAPDAAPNDQFGWALALGTDRLVVGAPFDDLVAADAGSAHVFSRTGSTWSHVGKLTATDADQNDSLGTSVALFGDVALIGAPGDSERAFACGAAYTFAPVGGVWMQHAKIIPGDGAVDDRFGTAVALTLGRAATGSPRDDDQGANSGSVYIFDQIGAAWVQATKLRPTGGLGLDIAGTTVAMVGSIVVIGAPGDDTPGPNAGTINVFQRSTGGTWQERPAFLPIAPQTGDAFGSAIGFDGARVIAGTPLANPSNLSDAGNASILLIAAVQDCDANGIPDARDVRCNGAADANADFIPDSCQSLPPCPGDTNGDRQVDNADLSVLLGSFNQSVPTGTGADYNADGQVNNADLSILLGRFGTGC